MMIPSQAPVESLGHVLTGRGLFRRVGWLVGVATVRSLDSEGAPQFDAVDVL